MQAEISRDSRLQQHIGAAPEVTVKTDDRVEVGDVLAKPAAGRLCVPVHASISGMVKAVGERVVIESV